MRGAKRAIYRASRPLGIRLCVGTHTYLSHPISRCRELDLRREIVSKAIKILGSGEEEGLLDKVPWKAWMHLGCRNQNRYYLSLSTSESSRVRFPRNDERTSTDVLHACVSLATHNNPELIKSNSVKLIARVGFKNPEFLDASAPLRPLLLRGRKNSFFARSGG